MEHLDEILCINTECAALSRQLKEKREALESRQDLLKRYMKQNNLTRVVHNDLVVTLSARDRTKTLKKAEKWNHVASTLREYNIMPDEGLIREITTFNGGETVSSEKLAFKASRSK